MFINHLYFKNFNLNLEKTVNNVQQIERLLENPQCKQLSQQTRTIKQFEKIRSRSSIGVKNLDQTIVKMKMEQKQKKSEVKKECKIDHKNQAFQKLPPKKNESLINMNKNIIHKHIQQQNIKNKNDQVNNNKSEKKIRYQKCLDIENQDKENIKPVQIKDNKQKIQKNSSHIKINKPLQHQKILEQKKQDCDNIDIEQRDKISELKQKQTIQNEVDSRKNLKPNVPLYITENYFNIDNQTLEQKRQKRENRLKPWDKSQTQKLLIKNLKI
ncbi:hypothetical protein PPERSA_01715 [Pseudocohnilembus persalinus]|uniref:Uncharacterized protein n=1 Tax=Pseudocohnilembus persalinus TaxID=266149 RepID=A0A0V0Q7Y9_PSEPJ|nr:hypothetical protein PPERSA_01715 [Pseudocohnilembus persalinus]|eukprot:KRW98277.1 hypothetical protein PPERSA_01715 [Pseudocohnilembus persalinus]